MRYLMTAAAVVASVAAVPAAAQALITGSGFSIPNTGTAGINSSTAVSTATGNVTGLTLTLTNLSHTYVGDLIFTLSHGAQNFTFANFNNADSGRSSNFSGTYIINDSAATLFTAAPANNNSTNGVVTAGTYRAAPSFASAFGGASALGNWTLSINDVQQQDTGSLGSWSLAISTSAVPEPATWAMMIGGFGMVGGSLRRRRNVKTQVSYA